MRTLRALALFIALIGLADANLAETKANAYVRSECVDLSMSGSFVFEGTLTFHIFAGPPNYESVSSGDTPEPGYILKLDAPICATGDENTDPNTAIEQIQIWRTSDAEDRERLERDLRRLVGQRVRVEGKSPFAAITGHHHAPLMLPTMRIRSVFDSTEAYGVVPSQEQEASQLPENDEEIDRETQRKALETIQADQREPGFIPYHPDPDLSKKVALLQKQYDEAVYEGLCHGEASKLNKLYYNLARVLTDGRDHAIGLNHLLRVNMRVYSRGDPDCCEQNKTRFAAAISIRWVLGCPTLEALEYVVSTKLHRGEQDALNVASKNQCLNFSAGQKASIEEVKLFNGYLANRIKLEPKSDFDYWIADPDAFRLIH